uniref:H15 domain-containing protein n=1 Tax=Zea mays TaxID=4577 RepID=B6TTN6_MAIZE|nr:hypothetical protein [Zea mays]
MPALAKPASRTAKPAAAPKPKPAAAKPKAATAGASHPPYFEMIKEAITALKERTGSSSQAIAKYVGDKHGQVILFATVLFTLVQRVYLRSSHVCCCPSVFLIARSLCVSC